MNKIKKGDEVIVISGKDKGRKGLVQTVLNDGEMLLIEDINTVKKHKKANPNTNDKGGIVIINKPINRSNVMIYNQSTGKGTRVGVRALEDGRKARYYKDSNELIDV